MTQDKCQLYLISPPKFDIDDMAHDLKEAFKGGPVPVFQLRMKNPDPLTHQYILPQEDEEVIRAAQILQPICKENNCAFILNDNVKLAAELGCDGVHLGLDDMSVKEARKLLGKNFIIGASCYASKDRAFQAGEEGADYVAFGAFYDTQTKTPRGRPTTELLEFWSKYTNLPCVAIGGIKTDNAAPIIKAGTNFIAVVTGVWDHEDGVTKAVKAFNTLF
jgi:thiamine-phosphate pyrophosphorylase